MEKTSKSLPRRRRLFGTALTAGAVALTAMSASPAGAAASSARTLDYVALGDSYASAPGVPTQVDAACGRSSSNYPSLVATSRGARLTDVSCSGATTADLATGQDGGAPQLDALDADTDLVTVSIGGNDLGFTTVLGTCAQLAPTDPTGAPCRTHFTGDGTDELQKAVDATGPKVSRVLKEVRERAPRAKVVVVGYPSLFPDSGTGCTSASVPFAVGDFAYLRDTNKALNAMLKQRAKRGGASYADTYTPTIGHDMCAPVGERWIESLAPQTPAAPAHPNAQGESAMAGSVQRVLSACGLTRR
ncbi:MULTISPECIES: SGNH/GDSL hydrolase family protein [Streptomyces]|uniref:SGNH/GDSL hydrolase family protein n=1 Tax=Streptomyces TaxID=1883 RepID=UPI00240DA504|nr:MULTISPECIES: SGNH/GDSL hydrolase family protein [Streptomyces]WFB88451.1 SGNH/GDSL hydrolase family protein [Streptomyces olivaceus]WGK50894.1 SGNH/GDSL hydrolase family protein [Streptomyces sp. B146]